MERIGDTDELAFEGIHLVVSSPRAMSDWRVGRHRKTRVIVRGDSYAVVAATEAGGRWRYVLASWTPGAHEHPSQTIVYDDDYVREREEMARARTRQTRERWVLLPAYLLLGFLPRPVKARLHERYGFEPRSLTEWSVRFELATCLFLVIVSIVEQSTFVFDLVGNLFVNVPVVLVLLPDAIVRSGSLVDDGFEPYGLYEWLFQPAWVARVRSEWSRLRERLRGEGGDRGERSVGRAGA